jgi:hypothetical protein
MSDFPHDGLLRLRANDVSYLVSDSKEYAPSVARSTSLDGVVDRGKTKRPKPFLEPGTHRLNSPPPKSAHDQSTVKRVPCEWHRGATVVHKRAKVGSFPTHK